MEAHHFSSQAHDLESCRLREEKRQLKLELKAIKDLAQKTEGERQQYCADLMAADERIKELEETKSKMYDANQLMNARIKELEATISILETTQKWISVKDRLPEEEKPYLIYIKGHKGVGDEQMIVYWDESRRDFCVGEEGWPIDDEYSEVTHWMPLPPPPTTEEK